MAKKNPLGLGTSTLVLLGAAGYIAWKVWLEPKTVPRRALKTPATAQPDPAAAAPYQWYWYGSGNQRDRVCRDTRTGAYVDDVMCEANELEGWGCC